MRISDLRERIALSFGQEWAPSFCKDIALSELSSMTVDEALKAGVEVELIWKAVCKVHPKETEKFR